MRAPQVKNKPQRPAPPKPQKPVVKVAGKEALTIKRVPKDFKIVDWDRAGRKIMIYGDSDMGKTTLAMLLNNPAFIGTDDGGGIMRHPVTGEKLKVVQGIEDYRDIRDALNSDIFNSHEDIVVDTITEVQRWMPQYMFETIKKQGGDTAVNLEDYGFHKGYRHWFETMELLLCDLNRWVRKGKNIILLAQSTGTKITNEYGEDYKRVTPDLYHDDKHSILNLVVQWCDHVFRVGYTNIEVDKKKKVSGGTQRAVYIHGDAKFIAKSRTISKEDYPCVEFKDKTDDSIWRLLFDGGE
jgi:hypothetical protein